MSKSALRLCYFVPARLPTEKAYGVQIVKMCEALANAGHRVSVWSPRRKQPRTVTGDLFKFYGLPPTFEHQTFWDLDLLGWAPIIRDVSAGRALVWIGSFFWSFCGAYRLRQSRPDLCLTRDAGAAFWLTVLGLPTIIEMHNIPRGPTLWLLKQALRHPALRLGVGVTSEITRNLQGLGLPTERALTLPDAVDCGQFADLPAPTACRQRLNLPLERRIIGYIGRFNMMGVSKGVSHLLQAFASLKQELPGDYTFVAVGGPAEDIPPLLEHAAQLGISEAEVIFRDHVPHQEVKFWMRACDVLAFIPPANRYYSLYVSPLKLFEYLAVGVPIVAADLPSFREILKHDETALLVDPHNSASAGSALARLLDDPPLALRLTAAGLRFAAENTWDRRVSRLITAAEERPRESS